MFPLRDINPAEKTPYVTFVLIAVIGAIWLIEFLVLLFQGPGHFAALVSTWGAIPSRLLTFGSRGDWQAAVTPFTHMFLHGGWMHVIGNLWFFRVFGDNVEDRMGHGRFLLFYLLSGLGAAVAQIAIDPMSRIPLVGASGAIAGVLAAYMVFHPTARVVTFVPLFFVIEVPAFVFIFVWFALQLVSGTASLGALEGSQAGGVAFFAHIGGFVVGVVLAPLFRVDRSAKTPTTPPRRSGQPWDGWRGGS